MQETTAATMDPNHSASPDTPPNQKSADKTVKYLGFAAVLTITFAAGMYLYTNVHKFDGWEGPDSVTITNAQHSTAQTRFSSCQRATPYAMRPEFDRAMSLVLQRLSEKQGRNWQDMGQFLSSVRNCLNVQYAASAVDMSGAEGQFRFTSQGDSQNLTIFVHPYFVVKSDLYTAEVLSHEMVHAARFAAGFTENAIQRTEGCYEEEAQAFWGGQLFDSALNPGEQNQIIQESYFAQRSGTVNEALAIVNHRNELLARPEADYLDAIRAWVRSQPGYQQQCRR